MVGLVIVCALLTVPAGHQIFGHQAHRRILRAIRSGPEVRPTAHELHHASHSLPARVLVNVVWLVFMTGIVLLAVVLR